MAPRTTPLFVRLPAGTAAALDRAAGNTGRHKQAIVSDILAERLAQPARTLALGRIDVASPTPPLDEVLTLEEAAALMKIPVDAIRERAEAGGLPGRRFGTEWRFTRSAIFDWLAEGEARPSKHIHIKR
jgi:excisionase family DNA binding protein